MRNLLLTTVSLTLLAGCAVMDARRAQNETGTALPPGERALTAREAGISADAPLSLPDAERLSLAWRPEMVTATQSVVSAEIAVSQAGVNMRPTLSGGATYSGSGSAAKATDWEFESDDSFGASLTLTWVIYDFGRTAAEKRRAVENLIAATETFRETYVERVYAVRDAYFSLAQSIAQCAVDEENLRQYDELLRQAELKFKIGSGKKYDVTKARADRSNALLSLITSSNSIATARATLNSQLGFAEAAPRYPINPDVTLPEPPESFGDLLALAKTNQPALRALRAKTSAASAAVDRAIADLYPELKISAGANEVFTSPESWGVSWGAELLETLFSGWSRRDAIRQSVTALRQARAAATQQEQTLTEKLATAYSAWLTARKGLTVAGELERQAQENLDLATKQFKVGTSSILELTDAQVLHTSAKSSLVKARYTLEKAKAAIFSTIGTDGKNLARN